MRSDPHNTRTRQHRKVVVLELLADEPRDEVPAAALALGQLAEDIGAADIALERDLDDDQRVGERALVVLERREEHKEVVRRCIRHELEVVGRVLVVGRDVERHHALEKDLARGVVRKEGVAVDVEELARRGVRAARD